ncbi:MAG: UbiD family decarboxylase domain-containing protein, partial [Armatimonadota bacterium]
MAYSSLSDFISLLESKNELVRIKHKVSSELEITEITDRVVKRNGPALLFEDVDDFNIPVLINHFGSYKRMSLALGVEDLNKIASQISSLVHSESPGTFLDKLKMLPKLVQLSSSFPKTVASAPCQEVVYTGDEVDLYNFPILKCWPKDGGRFVTLPIVFTKDRETGKRNAGMYRLQVFDKNTTGMHWHIHKVGARHFADYERHNEKMPVAVALGGDPAITYSATAPLPEDFDEMIFAGFLRKKP